MCWICCYIAIDRTDYDFFYCVGQLSLDLCLTFFVCTLECNQLNNTF
jgi:hypothetical protein